MSTIDQQPAGQPSPFEQRRLKRARKPRRTQAPSLLMTPERWDRFFTAVEAEEARRLSPQPPAAC